MPMKAIIDASARERECPDLPLSAQHLADPTVRDARPVQRARPTVLREEHHALPVRQPPIQRARRPRRDRPVDRALIDRGAPPPRAGTTMTCTFFAMLFVPCSCPMNATTRPSGENDGLFATPRLRVSLRAFPPTAATTHASLRNWRSCLRRSRSDENTIDLPSGDHDGCWSYQSPSVTCFASPPSAPMTKMCVRRLSK